MNTTFPLSDLSRARLRRNAAIALFGTIASLCLAIVTFNPLVGLLSFYFAPVFVWRLAILKNADPYLQISGDGLTVRWLRETFIPWSSVTDIRNVSDHAIRISYRNSEQSTRDLTLLRRRVERSDTPLEQILRDSHKQATGV